MKLQGFTIIFALVAIPLILVLAYYIQLQVNTITLQNAYDSKLLDATYDAMSSFEINTANEDLSSVSDSLRTIIEASNNVFFNTLATNLGMSNASKSRIEPYIPAVLYTLYDGYYISAPTQVPTVLTDSDGKAVSVGDPGVDWNGTSYTYEIVHTTETSQSKCPEGGENCPHVHYQVYNSKPEDYLLKYTNLADERKADYGQLLYLEANSTDRYTTKISDAAKKTDNVLKTYMPYSARYKSDANFDITVVYTLDNYVTIEGTIGKIYYTKSGYLLPESCVDKNNSQIKVETANGIDLLSYNQNDAQDFIQAGNSVTVKIGDIVISSGGDTNRNYDNLTLTLNNLENQLKQSPSDMGIQSQINDIKYEINQMSAVNYYVKAMIFSNWVYDNLKDVVLERNLVEISGQSYTSINGTEQVTYSFNGSDKKVFDTNGTTSEGITEIAVDSPFYTHKLNVIRNSIQYNLNLAMTTYNTQTSGTFNYEMPVMQNEEWNQILTNVSVVSFMQGYSCGLKTYNNYMVVSSTNNELTVDTSHIYYVDKNEFSNENTEYHRIDCPELYKIEDNNTGDPINYISFTSKEVKYDKIYDKNATVHQYQYDHKNLACYDCINDGNYDKVPIFDVSKPDYANLRRAYYMAVGKERNNIYKMNAVDNSEGYEIIYDKITPGNASSNGTLPLSEIKAIEIVLGTIRTRNTKENLRYEFSINNVSINSDDIQPNSISSNDTNDTSIRININPQIFVGNNNNLSMDSIVATNENESTYLKSPNEDITSENGYIYGTSVEDRNKAIFRNAIKYIRVIYK